MGITGVTRIMFLILIKINEQKICKNNLTQRKIGGWKSCGTFHKKEFVYVEVEKLWIEVMKWHQIDNENILVAP